MDHIKDIPPKKSALCNIYLAYYNAAETFPNRISSEQVAKQHLLEYCFPREFGVPFQEAALLFQAHGKPYLDKKNCHFNLSHSKGLIACGFSTTPLGIDVELKRPMSPHLSSRSCTPFELDQLAHCSDYSYTFLKLWTQKESYLKLTGQGITVSLNSLEIPASVFQKTYCLSQGYLLTISAFEPLRITFLDSLSF
ncbi:MAG: 4'-phosphopantetheinyl transferase superfamily protein [Lachnospiraceae bacterium]